MGVRKKSIEKNKKQSSQKKREDVFNIKSRTLRESLLEVLELVEERSSQKSNIFDEDKNSL